MKLRQSLTTRQGRKVPRMLYEQLGPEPADDDPIVGLVDTPELAALIVAAVNAGTPPAVDDDDLIEELAGMLVRIEANYERETSGPGSRFEGQRLEVVQARAVLRRIREVSRTGPEAVR